MSLPRQRTSPDAVILGISADSIGIARLREAYGSQLRVLATATELEREMRRKVAELIVVEPWDSAGQPTAPAIRALHAEQHWPPVAAYVDRRRESLHELVQLVRAGATELVLRDVDDSASALRRLERASAVSAIAADAIAIARAIVPMPLLPSVQHCLAHVREQLTARQIATAMGYQRRTLTQRAENAGLRGLRDVSARCRLVVAIGLILRAGQSTEQVALSLGFGSGSALHNMLKRHTGLRPKEIAVHGDLRFWCQRLLSAPGFLRDDGAVLLPSTTEPPSAAKRERDVAAGRADDEERPPE